MGIVTRSQYNAIFSSKSCKWKTPVDFYKKLDEEFHFNFDPCPINPTFDGLAYEWGSRTYCNPPYGRKIGLWIKKAYDESLNGKLVVMLLPSRTDTRWFHDFIINKAEIRFVKGRLYFNDGKGRSPFPSMVVIFNTRKPTL